MLLARLRWSAFGLRGRIVGAVLATTAISLGVAALVLLPRLETSLKNASAKTLTKEISGATSQLKSIAKVQYWLIPEVQSAPAKSNLYKRARHAQQSLSNDIARIGDAFGALGGVTLIGDIDSNGVGHPVSLGPGIVSS